MSDYLKQLKEQRKALWSEGEVILRKASAEQRELTADEQGRFDGIADQLTGLDGRIDDVEATAEQREAYEASLREAGVNLKGSTNAGAAPETRLMPSVEEVRAVGSSGSPLSATLQSNLFWDRLRGFTAVADQAIWRLPVVGGSALRIPKATASVTVSSGNENTAITPTDTTLSSITLTPRKYAALTLWSSEAVEDATPAALSVIEGDLVREMAGVLDNAMINGNGTAPNIRGLINISGTTAGPSLGANGGTPTLDNYAAMVASAESAGGRLEDLVFLMHPRSWATIRVAKDSQARYQVNPVPSGAEERSLFGIPVAVSSQFSLTTTVGSSNDTSQAVLLDRQQFVIGEARAPRLDVSTDYAFNADQVAVRITTRVDIGLVQPASTVVMTGVRP